MRAARGPRRPWPGNPGEPQSGGQSSKGQPSTRLGRGLEDHKEHGVGSGRSGDGGQA